MWISTRTAHPPIREGSRNDRVWLYEPGADVFLGYYVRFGDDEAADDSEYGDAKGQRYPTHFWDGEGAPTSLPQ